MRLHRLRITAFGPFAGSEEVDLDVLGEAGLFLLHGPTGAGKTSVLDAVCFALYGQVPGERGQERLRSDHAAENLAPEVVCEFSVGDRRLTISRSPAWQRPKKRGTGTTTQQTQVRVTERIGETESVLTTRADEAGHLIGSLLGLDLDQFTTLVLLPQGQFAAFLRAGTQERRVLLERLFATDRFTGVQNWLRERKRTEQQKVADAEGQTALVLARAREAVAELPRTGMSGEPDADDAADPQPQEAPDADPAAEIQALTDRAAAVRSEAVAKRARTRATSAAATAERERIVTLAARQQEHARLTERHRALSELSEEVDRARRLLRDADRATAFTSVSAELDAARRRRQDAADTFVAAVTTLAGLTAPAAWPGSTAGQSGSEIPVPAAVTPDQVATWSQAARADQERLEVALPRLAAVIAESTELASVEARILTLRGEVERAEEILRSARARVDSHADRREQMDGQLAEAERQAATVDAARADRDTARTVVDAVERRDGLHREEHAARDQLTRLREERDRAKEHWLDVRERRLEQIAVELSEGLSAGRPCPVCGSTEHPAPATTGAAARVDEATEQRAKAEVDTAEQEVQDAVDALSQLSANLAAASQAAQDKDRDTAGQDLAAAESRLAEAEHARERALDLTQRRQQLQDEAAVTLRDHRRAEETHRAAQEGLSEAQGSATTVRDRLAEASSRIPELTGPDSDDPASVETALRTRATALDAVVDAGDALSRAQDMLDASTRQATTAAGQAGFDDLDSALSAALSPERVEELTGFVTSTSEDLAAVTGTLANEDLLAAAAAPPADPETAIRAESAARVEDEAAASLETRATTATSALARLTEELTAHLTRCAPLIERSRELAELSECADGSGGDNALRMSLSAYVLAARLEQVAEAASLRLSAMSGGRYTLVHSEGREHGQRRAGLSLQVVDGWTGAERPTGTLSGGESFYASLALALGLADVVTAEAGGAAVETLFIDEGFGSLDDQALDEVMDVLDELRTGGRSVGVVSHVSDLRDRIPAQLQVVKTRRGSRLRQRVD